MHSLHSPCRCSLVCAALTAYWTRQDYAWIVHAHPIIIVWNRGDSRQSLLIPMGERPHELRQPLRSCRSTGRCLVTMCDSIQVLIWSSQIGYTAHDATYSRCSPTSRQRSARADSSSRADALHFSDAVSLPVPWRPVQQSERMAGQRRSRLLETMRGAF
jgi:hypothetical protein